ncbi:ABC transporter ATP-binding protein [Stackebrandtia nassauensis]|uniref:ABC transporter related protein n=1 Tax=Stackebrandtia nassauensis (strain DSM 44728 / CIP 108903 / NRRL B-16338 / NBRC 102104 / LLR-40K-21) TaxID=446470 RepID=D3PXH3_STANL|nr:ABC transporter ATP-binding protein [Stackebrandtia nassauensis]ADD41436.1 ABC transporter related protein [Stackebrandtia nassauensis DSM 44728]
MIDIRGLVKRYRATTAVDDLSFTVEPGSVTGFLGPNGAGKTTTMRILLGLAAATEGEALVKGERYPRLSEPTRSVGALLDAGDVHPGRSALSHLRAIAYANRIGDERVSAVLEQVGLAGVARKRVGKFSLGMKQRLGIAAALLGDPDVLILDEPVNGLDPDGVRWIRELTRGLADEGRTILISSHLMSEMELTADRLIIIARGKLIADTSVSELAERFQRGISVRSPRADELAQVLEAEGAAVAREADALLVNGLDVAAIGDLAAGKGIALHEVAPRRTTLEDAYMALTSDSLQFAARPGRNP